MYVYRCVCIISRFVWKPPSNFPHTLVSGTIPTELGRLTRLGYLPPPPDRFRGWPLQRFSLGENLLTGTIPDEVVEGLANVEMLDLSSNDLSGTLPTGFANWNRLHEFTVAGNPRLGGQVPSAFEEFAKNGSLGFVNISQTAITGVLPKVLCNEKKIEMHFDCSDALSGCNC